ncbi:hypothetical protein [Streptomyces sp. OE57]|uniref:hypothetical protein n=1 Tax=Streptomyces lacaronensis TaxID=3379885 RepID=UPI0039B72670
MTAPAEPGAPAMETLYAILDNGSIYMTSWEADQPGSPALPSPGRVVTEDEYRAELERINAANAQRIAAEEAEWQREAQEAYDALIAANIPASVASRLSGYQPPQEPPATA